MKASELKHAASLHGRVHGSTLTSRQSVASLIVAVAMLACAVGAAAQTAPMAAVQPPKSFCADCHLISSTPRSRAHLLDWQRSIHATRGVTCDACHGGDPAAVDPMRAHLAIRGSEDPASPIHRKNLPATCGACHTRSAEQFKKSGHFKALQSDTGTAAPTCSTCHGAAGTVLPEAEEVRLQCAQCHGIGKPAGHPEYPPAAKLVMAQYGAAQTMLEGARAFIPILSDAAQRASLEVDEARATQSLATAAESIHTMDYDTIDQKLTVAFDRVVALIRRSMTISPSTQR